MHSKPFNLAQAKAGAPVQLRKGISARIVCFDKKGVVNYPLLALVMDGSGTRESVLEISNSGHYSNSQQSDYDLVMAPFGMVEGKPVFMDDVLEFRTHSANAWHVVEVNSEIFALHPENEYRWPKPTLINVYRYATDGELWSAAKDGTKFDAHHRLSALWTFVYSYAEPQ